MEMRDFTDMTADEIAGYRGDTWHCSVRWIGSAGDPVVSDHSSTSDSNEQRKISAYERRKVLSVWYGPIVLGNGIVIARDPVTGQPVKDTPERYSRV